MKSPIFIAILILATQLAFAQNEPLTGRTNQKGNLYVYWGWNRGWYTTSDISFRGTDYDFHLAGYGISAVVAINISFYEIFFIQSELKGGYVSMPDIRTTMDKADRGSQSFLFSQLNIVFGVSFSLGKKTKT